MSNNWSFWWGNVADNLWVCADYNHVTAEVRQVGESKFFMSVDDCGDEYTGVFSRCADAMRSAERIMRDLLDDRYER